MGCVFVFNPPYNPNTVQLGQYPMKLLIKTLLIAALSVIAPATYAQSSNGKKCGWTRLGEVVDETFDHYIDYCEITGTNRFRFAPTMYDFKQKQQSQGYSYASVVNRRVYDCYSSSSASIASLYYQRSMARGVVIDSIFTPKEKWVFFSAPTLNLTANLYTAVCN